MVCLNLVSSPGPDFVKVRARFGKVSQVKDQVGQGQELDKNLQ